MTVEFVRTPDEAFEHLHGYPFAPNYLKDLPGYEGLRGHYVDEGPRDVERTFLCLHGEPTWSYLYRKMIPVFLETGARVVAPDFLGFGRSDKPVDDAVYSFDFHRNYLKAFIETLDLNNITLVCQDWGGLLGLTLPMEYPERFSRMIVMNTTLAVGKGSSEGFAKWKAYVAANPDLDVVALMQRTTPVLSESEAAAYGAPFPNKESKAGVRRFPEMVMIEPGMDGIEISKQAADFLKNSWQGECFMAVGASDPVLGLPAMEKLHAGIFGASELMVIEEAGHFVQEWGDPVARAALEYFGD
jgi:haloalkane dehalogenase